MALGRLYGIGVGPGDPELITIKAAEILAQCRHVFVPKTRTEKESTALAIAGKYLSSGSQTHELVFPMVMDQKALTRHWDDAAACIVTIIERGENACFLTLGDPFLYSTYIHLLQTLRKLAPDIEVITVPGITSFSAAAALTEFPIGKGNEEVSIVPAVDNLDAVREALQRGGTVVLMKIGKYLGKILELLNDLDLLDRGVFVSRAGLDGEYAEVNLRKLREQGIEAGYFSIMLIHAERHRDQGD